MSVVLPAVTGDANDVATQPMHRLIINDYLRQVDLNITQQDKNLKQLQEQVGRLTEMRIASIAQRGLLKELIKQLDTVEAAVAQLTPDGNGSAPSDSD